MITPKALLTGEDADKSPGIESSIDKWERIVSVLADVSYSAGVKCGLCVEAGRSPDEDLHHVYNCDKCVLGDCMKDDSSYHQIIKSLRETLKLSIALKAKLLRLRSRRE